MLSLLGERAYIGNLDKNLIVENRFHSSAIILYYPLNITCNWGVGKAKKYVFWLKVKLKDKL